MQSILRSCDGKAELRPILTLPCADQTTELQSEKWELADSVLGEDSGFGNVGGRRARRLTVQVTSQTRTNTIDLCACMRLPERVCSCGAPNRSSCCFLMCMATADATAGCHDNRRDAGIIVPVLLLSRWL